MAQEQIHYQKQQRCTIIGVMTDSDTYYWLNRVAVKLNKLFLSGEDLSKARRWIFDWNDDITKEDNLENVVAEDKAMTTFTIAGVIKTESLNNRYRDYLERDPEHPPRGISDWGNLDEPDPALLEYNRARFLEAFYYDKFVQFCKEQGLNHNENKILANLEIDHNQKPIVHAIGRTYTLKPLHDGSTLTVIRQAILHPGTPITFAMLREWTKEDNRFGDKRYFNQMFSANEFSTGNALSPFAMIESKTFTLNTEDVGLTSAELALIQKISIN